jgi:hypothetical protein
MEFQMTISTNFKVSYQCSECGKTFNGSNAKGDLYYHISWAHPTPKVYAPNDFIIDCEFCGTHVHESEYTSHILRRHPEEQ